MAMLLGSFGDKCGRKIPTLIAVVSKVFHSFFYMVFVTDPVFPVYTRLIEDDIISFLGAKLVFVSAQYVEAAHQTKDKTKLTRRFSILTTCTSCAIFFAGYLSPT